ncbi:MAG: hypothetical protein AAF171_17655 [Cyanobacteria bacterium P01_A01_bin.116]
MSSYTCYRVRREYDAQVSEEDPQPAAALQSFRARSKSVRWHSPSEGRSQQFLSSSGLDLEAHQAEARAVFDRKSLP